MPGRIRRALLGIVAAVALGAGALPGLAAQTDVPVVVNPDPVDFTPHVLDGKVQAITQVGTRVVVAGAFTQVAAAADPTPISRVNVFAFDADTGLVDLGFVPAVDGEVTSVAASADGTAVYLGGLFGKVNGSFAKAVAKVRLSDGALVEAFSASASARVMHLALNGDRLFLGGFFTSINGVARAGVAAVDATTGAVDPAIDVPLAGPRRGAGTPDVRKLDVSPDGTRLVIIGDFTSIGGARRDQVAIVDLDGPAAVLSSWATDRYQDACKSFFDATVRDIDISPDGKFFVVTTSGGYAPGSLCDTAARWELGATGPGQQPTWVDATGGDTLFSVAVTSSAVYVGGHQRWVNNPFAPDSAGPGAVAREGIAALHPQNGLPFTWNPGRTRGVGAFELTVTPKGLWVGSDTDRIGKMLEYHGRLALLPLEGGSPAPAEAASALPTDLYVVGPTGRGFGPSTLRRARLTTTGVLPSILDAAGDGLDWSAVRGAFMVNGRLFTAQVDGKVYASTFDGTTFAPAHVVNLNGLTPAEFPIAALTGVFYADGRVYYTVAGDTRLFARWFLPESEVFGAETFVVSGAGDGLVWANRGLAYAGGRIYFAAYKGELWSMALVNGVPDGASARRVPGGGGLVDWRARDLFTFNGPAGAGRVNAAPVPAATQTCDGLVCTYDGSASTDPDGALVAFRWTFGDGAVASGRSITRTWPGGGRKTATLTVTDDSGAARSYAFPFTVVDPSNIVPVPVASHVCDLALTCTLDATASTDPDGSIASAVWDLGDGTVAEGLVVAHEYPAAGTYPVTLTLSDDGGATATTTTTVTVAPPLNPKPEAVITSTCAERTCRLDGSASFDLNGSVVKHTWSFGDGTTGTGPVVDHTYATDGTYDVTLTVTDDGGASRSATSSVRVVQVAFRGTTTAFAFADTLAIRMPANVEPADVVLLFLTLDHISSAVMPPAGWAELTRVSDEGLRTIAWARVAGPGEAGALVTIGAGAKVRANLMTVAYGGTSPTAPVLAAAGLAEEVAQAGHASPAVVTLAPAWLVTYAADLGTTTAWTRGPGQRTRGEAFGTDTPHISVIASESMTTAPAGIQPQVTSTANSISGTATMLTIALRPNV